MSTMTTIKVPTELRDRLAELARSRHETMAEAVAYALDAAEEEEFWATARATMGAASSRTDLQQAAEQFSGTLPDGLEPEDWSDIL